MQSCTFTSETAQFLSPWNDSKHVSLRHLAVDGDVQQAVIDGNTFGRGLFGIYSTTRTSQNPVFLNATNNVFKDFYLAGICAEGDPAATGGFVTVSGDQTRFEFRTETALPNHPQVTDALSYDLTSPEQVTVGVRYRSYELNVFDAEFVQRDSALYTSYDYASKRTRQVGVLMGGGRTVLERNRFERLHEGARLWLQGAGPSNPAVRADLVSNGFTACAIGCLVAGGGEVRQQFTNTLTGVVTAPLFSSCNTFRRVNSRTGPSYGLISPVTSFVTFVSTDPIIDPQFPAVIRNRFDVQGASNTAMINVQVLNTNSIYRQNGSQWYHPKYAVFNSIWLVQGNAPNPTIYAGLDLADGGRDINTNDGECVNLFVGAGIQRSVNSGNATSSVHPTLAQNNPNPASEETVFNYVLPNTTKAAQLLIRRGTDGNEIAQLPLTLTKTSYTLNLRYYLPGVYFATLLVDGMPVQTRRILVR